MEILGVTKNNVTVIDRINSHFHPEGGLTKELLREAIGKIDLTETFQKEVIIFDHQIGFTTCVEVSSSDEIVMVKRIGRDGLTPMVRNREPEACKAITVILLKKEDMTEAIMLTAFIGSESTREPWDPGIKDDEERRKCIEYWSKHALIYNEELIDKN